MEGLEEGKTELGTEAKFDDSIIKLLMVLMLNGWIGRSSQIFPPSERCVNLSAHTAQALLSVNPLSRTFCRLRYLPSLGCFAYWGLTS